MFFEEGQQYLAPFLQARMYSAYLQKPITIVDFNAVVTIPAFYEIPRRYPLIPSSVPDSKFICSHSIRLDQFFVKFYCHLLTLKKGRNINLSGPVCIFVSNSLVKSYSKQVHFYFISLLHSLQILWNNNESLCLYHGGDHTSTGSGYRLNESTFIYSHSDEVPPS